ncbi:solute carrier organic anion transporter family member 2A1-like [Physella acuta]|uniref:solute carrier organic anion transporter family member 2A1-like n=1 Tax=Physella acuta TaxID=109671 RepID=UPI0027DAE662|nr:solute carrier organic anion transporter family member 2A1-like [Physella acuta]
MTTIRALKFSIIVNSMSLLACVMAFFFQCPQPEIHNWPSTNTTCNTGCQCADNSYFAICGQDGKTYYSPCTAGCLNSISGVYQNCTCIPGGQATSGSCDYGCDHIYAYAFFFTLRSLVSTLSIVPKLLIVIRLASWSRHHWLRHRRHLRHLGRQMFHQGALSAVRQRGL